MRYMVYIFLFAVLILSAKGANSQICAENAKQDICSAAEERGHDKHRHETADEVELSETAIKNYGIETQKPASSELQILPREALVTAKDKYLIYEKDGEHFKEIEITPQSITDKFVTFKDAGYKAEKEYVISGGAYLRIIFLNNSAPAGEHGH